MEKTAAFIRRSLTLLFALLAWLGGLLSGEASVSAGNMEIARTLEFSYGDGVSF